MKELAEELADRKCDLSLTWIRRDMNQLADDLTNEKFDSFDEAFRVPLDGNLIRWRVLDKLLGHADGYYGEMRAAKATGGRRPVRKFGKSRKLNPW